ncbi:tetratricopeptide repeat protein [Iningainema tapete]|uniref:Tetratricopeptide repeat protein n=1 Tax=Iningainema tapete BLCC-T55 TaxID=2748662 RepID=A0A8J6XUN2_9CYAN|nr:tetratricopeptide repeat protein [Iningainema tapete]MBD2776362.1 tetratricopeptide repeat protein [Iningainema tapete BLCC-T55]
MKCPVCGAVYRAAPNSYSCKRCKADLSDLIRLHDQAMWYHIKAMYLLQQEQYSAAEVNNNQALALHYSNADFHALAGKLSALQGKFSEAIAHWQQALKIEPQNAIASAGLDMIAMLKQ